MLLSLCLYMYILRINYHIDLLYPYQSVDPLIMIIHAALNYTCFVKVISSMIMKRIFLCQSKLYPILIQDVQLMINELGNVIVLWEELWLSTLQDLHSGRFLFPFLV